MSLLDNGHNIYTAHPEILVGGGDRWDYASDINENLWCQTFPYQLAVLQWAPNYNTSTTTPLAGTSGGYSVYNNLIFTLPVNPESLNNGTPFAISLTATLGGIVEQHGGAPIHPIAFTGTFGVVTDRPSASDLQPGILNAVSGVARGIASGTVESATAKQFAASMGLGTTYTANLSNPEPNDTDIQRGSTGYYQFRALQRFLETYAEAKKTSEGRGLRLGLFIHKEQACYLVTPQSFDLARDANSPLEYRYSLKMAAWKRLPPESIRLDNLYTANAENMTAGSGFAFSQVFGAVKKAVQMARSVGNVFRSIRRDAHTIFNAYRQVLLFCASSGSLVKTCLMFPADLRVGFAPATTNMWDAIKYAFDNQDPLLKVRMDLITSEVGRVRSGSAQQSPTLRQSLLDDEQVDFHDLICPDSLHTDNRTQQATQDYVTQVMSLTSHDFREIAQQTFDLIADYSDAVGLGDPLYDALVCRTPKTKIRDATLDDYRVLHALNDAGTAIQSLVINTPSRVPMSTVEYIAGLANQNNIAMRVPRSKFLVPFPYNSSLEQLALQYLGDESRWIEIAALNDLMAPYVDETGTVQALSSNGSGHLINLTSANTLALGQRISIWSDTVVAERRRIQSIRPLGPAQWQITLDGEPDLIKFKTVDNASVQCFAPNTVNSQQSLYIPSDSLANEEVLKYVPNESDVSHILSRSEVDGMLDASGDLVITPDGDWPFVLGLSYLIQWARVALNTPLKSVPLHPGFGLDARVGDSIADTSAQNILASIKNTFKSNPSFSGVSSALVTRSGPTTSVTLELGVRGSDAALPLTFDLA